MIAKRTVLTCIRYINIPKKVRSLFASTVKPLHTLASLPEAFFANRQTDRHGGIALPLLCTCTCRKKVNREDPPPHTHIYMHIHGAVEVLYTWLSFTVTR